MATSKSKPAPTASAKAAPAAAKPAPVAAKAAPVAAKAAPAAAPKPVAVKAPTKVAAAAVSSEQRQRMIAEAAYYLAEKRGFAHGSHDSDWAEAERQIDASLKA